MIKTCSDGGYVYALSSGGFIKIGATTNPKNRLSSLKSGLGHKVDSYFVSKWVANPLAIEKICHIRFSECRERGEWFNIDNECAIKAIEEAVNSSKEGVPPKKISCNSAFNDMVSSVAMDSFHKDNIDEINDTLELIHASGMIHMEDILIAGVNRHLLSKIREVCITAMLDDAVEAIKAQSDLISILKSK